MQIVYANVCQYFNLEKLAMMTSIGLCSCGCVVSGSDRTYIKFITSHISCVRAFFSGLKFGRRSLVPAGQISSSQSQLHVSSLEGLSLSHSHATRKVCRFHRLKKITFGIFSCGKKRWVGRQTLLRSDSPFKRTRQMFARRTRTHELAAKWNTETQNKNLRSEVMQIVPTLLCIFFLCWRCTCSYCENDSVKFRLYWAMFHIRNSAQ